MRPTFNPFSDWALVQKSQDEFVYFEGPFTSSPLPAQKFPEGLYINDFWLQNPRPYLVPSEKPQKWTKSELIEHIKPELSSQKISVKWQSPDKEKFSRDFGETQILIRQGGLEKAVPGTILVGQIKGFHSSMMRQSLFSILQKTQNYPVFMYALSVNGVVQWGASPEILFSLKGKTLKTMALAGTRPTALREELMSSVKDNREHDLVLRDLQNRLKNLGPIHSDPKAILDFPTLSHLHTGLSVNCIEKPLFKDCLELLHPTPALGVYPRSQLNRWKNLRQNQEKTKELGAPLGILGPDSFTCLVRIRYARLESSTGHLSLEAGCGVLQESDFESEWNELLGKLASIKRILGFE